FLCRRLPRPLRRPSLAASNLRDLRRPCHRRGPRKDLRRLSLQGTLVHTLCYLLPVHFQSMSSPCQEHYPRTSCHPTHYPKPYKEQHGCSALKLGRRSFPPPWGSLPSYRQAEIHLKAEECWEEWLAVLRLCRKPAQVGSQQQYPVFPCGQYSLVKCSPRRDL